MTLRFHEIAESSHRILNPFDEEKLRLVGEVCALREGMRLLDLACGKGELLAQWAQKHGIMGVGVDISATFIEAAKQRAFDMDVGDKLHFVTGDAADYPEEHHKFDLVSCVGATWIGGGLLGTLDLMHTALKPEGGLLVVGEPFWHEPPTAEVCAALQCEPDTYADLGGTLARLESAGYDLLEMVLANQDEWDRYEAQQWMAVTQFLAENPDDTDSDALQAWVAKNRRVYLTYGRRYLGWGVFVLRASGECPPARERPMAPGRPVGVDVVEDMVWARLEDGRVIGNPLAWYPWLQEASPEQRENVELTTRMILWHDLNRHIEIAAMLQGKQL